MSFGIHNSDQDIMTSRKVLQAFAKGMIPELQQFLHEPAEIFRR